MDSKAWEGVIWAVITGLCGFGVAKSRKPTPKLVFSLFAISTGTVAVDCFTSTASTACQQLATPREHRQLPSHTHWVKVSKNSSGPSQEIQPTLIAKRIGKLDLLRDSN